MALNRKTPKTRLTNSKAEALKTEINITVQAPLPGNNRIRIADIQNPCAVAITSLVEQTLSGAGCQPALSHRLIRIRRRRWYGVGVVFDQLCEIRQCRV